MTLLGMMSDVVARAERTTRVAHGERFATTRLLLRDGRVLEQLNPGVSDLENEWRQVGAFSDLASALEDLRRAGWSARRVDAEKNSVLRLVTSAAVVTVVAIVAMRAAGPLVLIGLTPVVAAILFKAVVGLRQPR